MTTALYNLRHDGDQYRVTKFDADLNVESSYLMTAEECTCPAGVRTTCRHRQMFPFLLSKIDSAAFYEFETGHWFTNEPAPADAATASDIAPTPESMPDIKWSSIDSVSIDQVTGRDWPSKVISVSTPATFKRRF